MTINKQQIINAMQKIGTENGFKQSVIECVINNANIIDELHETVKMNEYGLNTDDIVKFLYDFNDIEMGGIMENFIVCEHEMNEYRK